MKEEEMKQLIVLGNGFDLACDLHISQSDAKGNIRKYTTRYGDYFDYLISIIADDEDALKHPFTSLVKTEDFTKIPSAWVYIFAWYAEYDYRLGKPGAWKDVESLIADFLTSNDFFSTNGGSALRKPSIRGYPRIGIPYCPDPETYATDERDLIVIDSIEKLYFTLNRYFLSVNKRNTVCDENNVDSFPENISMTQWHRIFLTELEKQESNFRGYLKRLINDDGDYLQHANKLYDCIRLTDPMVERCEKRSESLRGKEDDIILSFNYTRPLNKPVSQYCNIHGSIQDDNAIFGISESDSVGGDDAYMFLKSVRLMTCNNQLDIDRWDFLRNLHPSEGFDAVKIFGSSLGSSDYPYFDDIFSEAKIERCETFIGFYYAKRSDEQESDENLLKELVKNVRTLINHYAEVHCDDQNGRLFRQLQLSGMLGIYELSNDYD